MSIFIFFICMEKRDIHDDGWNREHNFMQKQRRLLSQKIRDYISQQQ